MTRTIIIFSIFILAACGTSLSRKQSSLENDKKTFPASGRYNVEAIEHLENGKSFHTKGAVSVVNDFGFIKFRGSEPVKGIDSISINLNDSTLLSKFLKNQFIGTISVPAIESETGEAYSGYVFGFENTGGIANIKELKHLINEENLSGEQHLFIVGKSEKTNSFVIEQLEKVVSSGKILLDIDRTFVLTPNNFSQH